MQISRHDLIAASLFIGLGGFFAIEALNYDLGTPLRMGPGFLPLTLGSLLAVLGLAIGVKGFSKGADEVTDPVPWRAVLLVSLAVAFSAVTLRGLGFVPTVFITVFVTGLASRMNSVVGAALIAAGLTAMSAVIFVVGLRLQVPLIGPWLGGRW
jgi:hypothetical protein